MPSPSPGTDPAPNADTDSDASKLHALLLAAASEVVGPSLAREVFSISRERPMRTPAGSSSPSPRTPAADFRCHAPVTLFRRLLARATRRPPPRSPGDGDGVRTRNADETLENLVVREKDVLDAVDVSHIVASHGEVAVFADAAVPSHDVTVTIITVSSYGTVRSRAFASAEALADAVVEAADPTALGALVADVRVEKSSTRGARTENRYGLLVRPARVTRTRDEPPPLPRDGERTKSDDDDDVFVPGESENENETKTNKKTKKRRRPSKLGGELRLVTAARLRSARASDLLLCRSCGFFLQGDKGLREHSQVRHGASYEASLERVADARNALVVFEGARDASKKRSAEGDEKDAFFSKEASDVCETTSFSTARASTLRARESLPLGLRLARDGHLASLRALVSDTGWDPTSDDSVDANGSCALHWAAGRGRLAICAFLVDELGEDPRRAQKRDGRTAMHWAARNGRLETCRWLVQKCGVSVNEATRDGTTPFMWCVWGGGGAEATEAKDEDEDEDEDEDAVDFAGALRFLTSDAKCDVHATNAFGCNASQWAAQRAVGSVAMCAYLKNVGVDLKVTNGNGHSALHKAAVKGNRAACEWLLGAGGLGLEHLRADGDGNTPGEMARLEGHEELAAWLAEKTRTLEGERSAGA